MTGLDREQARDDRDYIARTIATVRNHRDAENCWPQWANIFADEIERLDALLAERDERIRRLEEALTEYADHQAWRCKYRQRYKECQCGLDETLATLGFPPIPVHDPEAKG